MTVSREQTERREYRYFFIENQGEMHEGRPVYRVYNKRSGGQIAILSYYPKWKQYVFSSTEGIVFNDSCLLDILDFMSLIAEWAEGRGK